VDASLIHPREVFRKAIQGNCAAVIIVHNHPSGDPTPSAEDVRVTRQLVQAGRIVGIKVVDHVVIGRRVAERRSDHVSLREAGLVDFCDGGNG
jgi:DNA repair protein RadC